MSSPDASAWRHWLAGYRAEFLGGDIGAAVVTTLLLVPQSVAYALLAGLPPQAGIYAGILPPLAYALFGSSNTLAVGPMAVTSLMTAAALAPLAGQGTALYLLGAMWLAVIGGVGLLLAGLLRFGFLTQLLSLPVLSGFTTAAALLIAWSQLSPLLGIRLDGFDIAAPRAAIDKLTWSPAIAAIGFSTLLALWLTQRWAALFLQRVLHIGAGTAQLCARLMPALIVALATAITAWAQLDTRAHVEVVGVVQAGLPALAIAAIDSRFFGALLLPGLMIALVNFVSSVSIAQSLGALRHERIDANAELRGLGAANLAAGLFGGLPVNGGLSRSAVNFAAGARTPLAGVLTALLMLVVALLGGELFRHMPVSALAATIIIALLGLMDVGTLRQAWRYDRTDALAWLLTAAGVLVFGVVQGIVLGVVTSVISLVWRSSHPHIAVLGRLPGTEQFRNVLRYDTEQLPHVLFCRIDENLFFGNIQAIDQRLRDEIDRHPAARHLVLSMLSVSQIDLTAVDALRQLHTELELRDVKLHLSDLKGPVEDRLRRTPLWTQLGGRVFISTFAAYRALIANGSEDYSI
jgi:SulP family sulfate permease